MRRASIVLLAAGAIVQGCCEAWTPTPPSLSPSLPTIAGRPRENHKSHRRPSGRSDRQTRNNNPETVRNMIGTGFSFEDGEQVLVSVQKPFGIVLEQGSDDENDNTENDNRIIVTEVDPDGSAGKAGVREGDVLVAVQNASTVSADLAEVLGFIANKCPRVVNLRFQRATD
mmetsp:Transcript_1627/g.3573  ORF Transcript_1627/g.3573 Transcript_1627/m.3573 type:complete len:171 (-) Transcript_1627:276-788(-)|eukprot:CAMPEP_0201131438 /NCGR_PEP_ID=MMETSP0850-20130426/42811_1 /ASSEMBLY_ACC=CAM_ASM_000622 /TAXON_ID=183588 /ORGANISM="Pseudo-nitzschia fraudulenta, Strain WWA7" /LENGTH=170 /DNA_ID=CAMNT_0047401477 /DNA_START=168 /DNA_END=680 /DNA_ORIENTATION=-